MTTSAETPLRRRRIGFAWFSIVAGIVGWFASFELLTEYIKTLQEPTHAPNCNISKLVTCGPNMDSWQGSLFGFSNTIIGVTAFTAPILVGAAILAGAHFAQWFWRLYCLGLLGGIVFITWLQYQSFYSLGTLCPWCMVVWTAMIPLWWVTVATAGAVGLLLPGVSAMRALKGFASWAWVAILLHFVIVATVAQLAVDWLLEFRL